jgi:hypothetical protein
LQSRGKMKGPRSAWRHWGGNGIRSERTTGTIVRNSSIPPWQQGHRSKVTNEFLMAYLASVLDSVNKLPHLTWNIVVKHGKEVAEKRDPQYSMLYHQCESHILGAGILEIFHLHLRVYQDIFWVYPMQIQEGKRRRESRWWRRRETEGSTRGTREATQRRGRKRPAGQDGRREIPG